MNQSREQIPLQCLDNAPFHVASLAIHLQPGRLPEFKQWLTDQQGVEIHAETDSGKLVVVIETQDQAAITRLIDAAHQQPGVINAALVYHEIISEEL